MNKRFWMVLFALLLSTVTPSFAITYLVPSDEQLVDRSEMIVRGRVLDVRSRVAADGRFETVVRVAVERTLKGEMSSSEIELVQPGGTDGKRWAAIAGAPQYRVSEESLFFLTRNSRGDWQTYGLALGKFDLLTTTDGRHVAVRDAAEMIDSEGVAVRDSIRLADSFERFVAQRTRSLGKEKIAATAVTSSKGVEFATESTRHIGATFVEADYLVTLGGLPAKWAGTAGGPVFKSFSTAQTGLTLSASAAAATNAVNSWNSASASNLSMPPVATSGGTLVTYTGFGSASDNISSIVFNAPPSAFPAEQGIAAFTAIYGGAGAITEADVYIDASVPGNQTQLFEQILTHEVGHALGFRHSNQGTPNDPNAVMNSSVNGSFGTTLQCWDRDALSTVYGGTPTCSGVPSFVRQPASQTITSGNSAGLDVQAGGGCNFTYQWYQGASGNTSSPIAGATNAVLFVNPTSTTDYWVQVTDFCGTSNSAAATITVNPCNGVSIATQPQGGTIPSGQSIVLSVGVNSGADAPVTYQWFRNGSQIAGATGTSFTANLAGDYFVRITNPCNVVDSNIATVAIGACQTPAITTQPASKTITSAQTVPLSVVATGTAPLTYQWFRGNSGDTSSAVAGATAAAFTTPSINITSSFWVRVTNSCGSANSATALITFNGCSAPPQFSIFAPGSATTDIDYPVSWDAVNGASSYELQEAMSPDFNGAVSFTLTSTSRTFVHTVSAPTHYYYRARATASCNGSVGPFSAVIDVVASPVPSANDLVPNVVMPLGADEPVTLTYHLSAPPSSKQALDSTFNASSDKPFMKVTPATGPLPPTGANLSVTIDPKGLPAGTNTATLVVTSSSGVPLANVPVGVSLASPVTSKPKTSSQSTALVIPVIGHAQGGNNSLFLSDVRLLNASNAAMKYLMTYTPSGTNGLTSGKQLTLDVAPGEIKALNDIAKSFFGLGGAGDSAVGVLDIRSANEAILDPKTTVASSRTYNITESGTFGQYIPAIPSSTFVAKGAKLSLQQIAQSEQYRTNLGLVEGAGQPVTATIRVFNASGQKVGEVPASLQPFEHRQINSFLSVNGITLEDGRIEIEVTSDSGKMSAYASVVDNNTNDPLLVSPVVVGQTSSSDYVVPGVADLTNANANWRTDVRLFNSTNAPVMATLTYYPQQGSGASQSKQVVIPANGIKVLDGVLQSFFGLSNSGGALHIRTANASSLVATARTYDAKRDSAGKSLTYGQFIPAVTSADATGANERTLQVLQVEESARFRSNLGLTEVTGQPVTVELRAFAPDALATPIKTVTLNGNDFVQLNQVLKQMNFTTAYNARISVKVIGGTGRVAAYASVIDNRTQDPTYIPAQ